jgi:predicted  nucleic acid-binding Zn-ribbon protein
MKFWNWFRWLWSAQNEVSSLGRNVVTQSEAVHTQFDWLVRLQNRIEHLEAQLTDHQQQLQDLRRILTARKEQQKVVPIVARNWREVQRLTEIEIESTR